MPSNRHLQARLVVIQEILAEQMQEERIATLNRALLGMAASSDWPEIDKLLNGLDVSTLSELELRFYQKASFAVRGQCTSWRSLTTRIANRLAAMPSSIPINKGN